MKNKKIVGYLFFIIFLLDGCLMPNDINQLNGYDKANALVQNFGKHVGVHDAILDKNNDRSFGGFGFYYDSKKDILIGRVYITKSDLSEATQEETESINRVMKALKNPKKGGMFDNGGGSFVLNIDKQILFLIKEYPLISTTSKKLRKDMDNLINLGATWSMRWFSRVAGIAHGWESAPTKKVTRKTEKE
jgi:hypothetical protein